MNLCFIILQMTLHLTILLFTVLCVINATNCVEITSCFIINKRTGA
jgi:hypothetical protein